MTGKTFATLIETSSGGNNAYNKETQKHQDSN